MRPRIRGFYYAFTPQQPRVNAPVLWKCWGLRTSVLLAMCEYNRRLSSNLVHRVLANPSKEHLDKLMDVIQLGNLSSLSNVLDEEVLEFLRSLVSQP